MRLDHLPARALICIAAIAAPAPAVVAAEAPLPSLADRTRGMQKMEGFIPLHWDAQGGKLYMELGGELSRFGEELIYVTSLPSGMGSNDIGLDRGQIGREAVVSFERIGPKVLMIQPNQAHRAVSSDPDERRAVEESFARSVLWGFKVEAASGDRVLVDATEFAIRDTHGIARALKNTGQGAFTVDASRSALHLPRTRSFPRNTEIEVTLTFTGDQPGGWVRDVTPTPEAITLQMRHSFIASPEPGYEPRPAHPGSGYFGITYADFAVPIAEPIRKNFIARHRLQRKNPGAARGEAAEPIVYYLDRGVPEPIRTALLEGARWWAAAFEAAGWTNAFRVEMLPEGADPMDVRYNVIEWVHRATRGWSMGQTVMDPRTGEILKGHVILGSLRVRQDYLIAQGLLSPWETGHEKPPEMEAMALARLAQLSAHEVGHTLGLSHNYIASAQGRASVMDYPHPLVSLRPDGSLDLSDAYARGVGEWDKVAIDYGYREMPQGATGQAALEKILADARGRGLTFLTDQDARPTGGAHPQAHLWDNGADAVSELQRVMKVRRAALSRFGDNAIRPGAPLATLEEVLVPVYLHHRYQVEAAVKLIAGQRYSFALRGDGQEPLAPVSAVDQRRALQAVLATLDPSELTIPRSLLKHLPPRPDWFPAHRELFARHTGLTFDAVAPAAAAADMVVALILDPQRAARLVGQPAIEPGLPGFGETLDALVESVFDAEAGDPYAAEVRRAVQAVVSARLMGLALSAPMPQVRAVARGRLGALRARAMRASGVASDESDKAHLDLLAADIGLFLDRPWDPARLAAPLPSPPGSPIGEADCAW